MLVNLHLYFVFIAATVAENAFSTTPEKNSVVDPKTKTKKKSLIAEGGAASAPATIYYHKHFLQPSLAIHTLHLSVITIP